jgi:hypothetical protein
LPNKQTQDTVDLTQRLQASIDRVGSLLGVLVGRGAQADADVPGSIEFDMFLN